LLYLLLTSLFFYSGFGFINIFLELVEEIREFLF
jgi:hypothetical protein